MRLGLVQVELINFVPEAAGKNGMEIDYDFISNEVDYGCYLLRMRGFFSGFVRPEASDCGGGIVRSGWTVIGAIFFGTTRGEIFARVTNPLIESGRYCN